MQNCARAGQLGNVQDDCQQALVTDQALEKGVKTCKVSFSHAAYAPF